MQPGIFTKTFKHATLEGVLDAIKAYDLTCVQFNLSSAGLPSLPDYPDPAAYDYIQEAMAARGLTMAAISGTFNMIHPDVKERQHGLQQLGVLAVACQWLRTSVITLCTGTRDPYDKWRYHPDNATPEAWRDLVTSMETALRIAEENHVTLAIEPELSNVVDSASKARQLLNEMQSSHLKIIMDAANLFPAGTLARQHEILDEAFSLLVEDIILAHAKDISQDGEAGHEAAGTGLLDYPYYLSLLKQSGFHGPLILHGLAESQVAQSVAFLRGLLEQEKGE